MSYTRESAFGDLDSVATEEDINKTCPKCDAVLLSNINYDVCPHCSSPLTKASGFYSKFRVVALGELQQPGGVGGTQEQGLNDTGHGDSAGAIDDRPAQDMTDVGLGSTEENLALETWVNYAVDMLNRGRQPEEVNAQLAHDGCPAPEEVMKRAMEQPPEEATQPGAPDGSQDPFDIPFQEGQGDAQLEDVHNQPPVVTSSFKASEWEKPWIVDNTGEDADGDDGSNIVGGDEEKKEEEEEQKKAKLASPYGSDGYGDTPYRTVQWECPNCKNWNYEYAGLHGGQEWHDCEKCEFKETSPMTFNRRRAPEGWNEQDQGVYDYDEGWEPMSRAGSSRTADEAEVFHIDVPKTEPTEYANTTPKTEPKIFDVDPPEGKPAGPFDVDETEETENDINDVKVDGEASVQEVKKFVGRRVRVAGVQGEVREEFESLWGEPYLKVALDDGRTIEATPDMLETGETSNALTEVQQFIDSIPPVEPTRPSIMARIDNLKTARQLIARNMQFSPGQWDILTALYDLDTHYSNELLELKDNLNLSDPAYLASLQKIGDVDFGQTSLSNVGWNKHIPEHAAIFVSELDSRVREDEGQLIYAAARYARLHNGDAQLFLAAVKKAALPGGFGQSIRDRQSPDWGGNNLEDIAPGLDRRMNDSAESTANCPSCGIAKELPYEACTNCGYHDKLY